MREARGGRPERLVDQQLLGRVRDVIVAADHVGDAHVHVVGHHAQVIGGLAVRAEQHEVFELRGVEADLAVHGVGERDGALVGHAEADGAWRAGRFTASYLFGRQLERGVRAGVGRRLAAFGGVAQRARLLGRAVVEVGVAAAHELLGNLAVTVVPLRLEVRSVGPAHIRPFVPGQPEPAEPVEDARHHLVRGALGVGVLDPQDERAAMPTREQPIEQRGTRAAHVQVAGGGWGETDTHGGHDNDTRKLKGDA